MMIRAMRELIIISPISQAMVAAYHWPLNDAYCHWLLNAMTMPLPAKRATQLASDAAITAIFSARHFRAVRVRAIDARHYLFSPRAPRRRYVGRYFSTRHIGAYVTIECLSQMAAGWSDTNTSVRADAHY